METCILQLLDVLWVHLVTVAVTLIGGSALKSVERAELGSFAVLLEESRAGTQTHGPTEVYLINFGHVHDDWAGGTLVKLDGVGVLKAEDVVGVFDHGNLHTQADAEVRLTLGTGVVSSTHHSDGTSCTETSRDQNAVGSADIVPGLVVLLAFGTWTF